MNKIKSIGWIKTPFKQSINNPELVYFRKQLDLDEYPDIYNIDITADAKYKLYINGELVNVGPQKGDKQIWYYDNLDIANYLEKGKNIIVVQVMIIPNRTRGGNYSFARTETPGLYINSNYGLVADSSWKCVVSPVHIIAEDTHFSPLYIFEEAKGCNLNCGIHNMLYNDSSWSPVLVYEPFYLSERLKPENLIQRKIPLLKLKNSKFSTVKEVRESKFTKDIWESFLTNNKLITIPPNSCEIIEFSAGVESTGFLKLSMYNGLGAKIEILTSECYAYEGIEGVEGPILPRKSDRTDSINGKLYGFTDSYHVFGNGSPNLPEIYEPFWFRTFRYIKLTIKTSNTPLTVKGFDFIENGYPLNVKTSVETSDPTLKGIWDISERSLKLCMHETYEDCPFYEQLQYAMDTRSQILYTYAISADDRLARQAIDDYKRSARFDGMINCSYPNNEDHVIPGFGIFYIEMVYDHMMYFGDKKLIFENMPAILGVLNFFRSRMDSSGILSKIGGPLFKEKFWSFIDWTDPWRDTIGVPPATLKGPLTMESFYYVTALLHSAELFEYLGFTNLSNSLVTEADGIKEALRKLCRGENGMFTDGPGVEEYSQHCQVFAILTNTIDVETGRDYLLETFSDPKKYAQCSVAMMFYLFRALEKCDLYYKTDELWDIWRGMLKKNLTTCEEDSVHSRSDCHAWGALALYEIPTVTLGVRPGAPGYSKVIINPIPGKLKWAKGNVITPKGIISVSWEIKNNGLEIKSNIPEGLPLKIMEK